MAGVAVTVDDKLTAVSALERSYAPLLAEDDAEWLRALLAEFKDEVPVAGVRPAIARQVATVIEAVDPILAETFYVVAGDAEGPFGARALVRAAELNLDVICRPAHAAAYAARVLNADGLPFDVIAAARKVAVRAAELLPKPVEVTAAPAAPTVGQWAPPKELNIEDLAGASAPVAAPSA